MQPSFPRILSLLLLILSVAALPAQNDAPVSELYPLMIEMQADRGSLNRYYFIENSPERRERWRAFYRSYEQRLEQFDFNRLSVNGKVDYVLTQRKIEDQLYRLDREEEECAALKEWTDFGDPLYALEVKRRRGRSMDGEKVAGELYDLTAALEDKMAALNATEVTFSTREARRGKGTIRGFRKALSSVNEFYRGYDPDFGWWCDRPIARLDKLLQQYEKAIGERVDTSTLPPDDGSGIIGNPIGRRELLRQLERECIPYSPEELVDIATKEFAWCDQELLRASREMGFGDDWKAAQEKVKQSFVPPGEQPEAMLELYEQSMAFLREHDLITIPPVAAETWRMKMIPPERQRISPFFLGGEVLQISYPTDEMEHEEKLMSMRGNNPHFSRATVHHELIAGHHLQMFMNERNKPYRNFRTPFWIEGWALYWELLLWEMDFPRSPEDRIGMLFWRMHRCARIIFSLNYHLGEWTPQQCIDYLVDRVGHERANAEGEVRRSFTGNYGPLYQIAYMVGGMQFYELKRELVDSGKMTYRAFHDAVMRENMMPVEMLRAILTEEAPAKDFKTSWRFYRK